METLQLSLGTNKCFSQKYQSRDGHRRRTGLDWNYSHRQLLLWMCQRLARPLMTSVSYLINSTTH